MTRWIALLLFCWVGFAQVAFNPQPQIQRLRLEEEAVRFVSFRTQSLVLVGVTPPFSGFERVLTGKTLTVIAGDQDRNKLTWLNGRSFNLRFLPGRVNGDFLLADGRYLLARKGNEWLLMDHPPTVVILQQQLLQALQSTQR